MHNSLIRYINKWGRRSPATLLLHIALVVIVIGALVTHFTGIQGTVSLMKGAETSTSTYINTDNGRQESFPFAITLNDCHITYYPATSAPMDYVSEVTVTDGDSICHGTVAMNRIFTYDHWRFYQTGISGDSSTLTIARDPWGIAITYCGYSLLLLAMLTFFLQPKSIWCTLLRSSSKAVATIALLMTSFTSHAAPQVLQRPLAADFGRMWVCRHDRVEQMQSFAIDFTTKLCGKSCYKGFTAEQVITGWLFYYDDWKHQPMIKVKEEKCRQLLGIDGQWASLTDFFNATGYKLDAAIKADLNNKELRRLDECVALISSVCTGAAFLIYPCTLDDGRLEWLSWVDRRPSSLSMEQWEFILTSHTRLFNDINSGHYLDADSVIKQIIDRQTSMMPPHSLLGASAERCLNHLRGYSLAMAIAAIVAGLLCLWMASRRRLTMLFTAVNIIILLYCITLLTLRGIIGRHWPLTDGYETLLFLAMLSTLLALVMRRNLQLMTGAGLTIAGCSLMCAYMTTTNPSVTPLLPVLASPWLAIHVMLVMGAYALMAFMAVISLTAIVSHDSAKAAEISRVNYLLLLPAVFLLMAGMFTGAVWANQSWGRYWGWDPKETCALITLLYYAVPLHRAMLRAMRRPAVINIYLATGILVVLFTYFGANYLLPGLHSYAVR